MKKHQKDFLARHGDPEHLDKLIDNPNLRWKVAGFAQNLTAEQLDKLVNDSNDLVRANVANQRNLTGDQVEKLVNDPDNLVRVNITQHPKTTKEQLEKLAKDKSLWVGNTALDRLESFE